MLIFTGMRRGELISLRLSDVSLGEKTVVVKGKGGNVRARGPGDDLDLPARLRVAPAGGGGAAAAERGETAGAGRPGTAGGRRVALQACVAAASPWAPDLPRPVRAEAPGRRRAAPGAEEP
jgi:hypothetical protein